MIKQEKYHHSVTENNKLQLRIVTQYCDDLGKVLSKKYSDPVTPADPAKMTDWDTTSQAIVSAVSKAAEPTTKIVADGMEEIISFDRVIEDDGRIAVRRIQRVFDGGKEVSRKYRRMWINPGNDIDKHPTADEVSKAIARALHTPEVITAYEAGRK